MIPATLPDEEAGLDVLAYLLASALAALGGGMLPAREPLPDVDVSDVGGRDA